MPTSPFQFITLKAPTFVQQYVHIPGVAGAVLESVPMGKSQIQALIAEHLKAIDELSGTETVAMIRLPVGNWSRDGIMNGLLDQYDDDLNATESNGRLRVWKK